MFLLESLRRCRHSHGYGVQSPFGYELVTRCVRPGGYAWYGYSDIDASLGGGNFSHRIRSEARMLLRFITMLRPHTVFLPTGINRAYQTAVRCGNSQIRIERTASSARACDLVCSHSDFLNIEMLRDIVTIPGHWLVLKDYPSGWDDTLFEALPEGVALVGRRNLIVINRPGMRKQRYAMAIG